MALHDKVAQERERRTAHRGYAVPASFQGVSKDRIRSALQYLALGDNTELVDCVFALLDNDTPSWFPKAPAGTKFCDGASTAHLGCHIGILQRGQGKLDREGRDYWIKPLRDLGGIEPITLIDGNFVPGHPVAKASTSAYRLEDRFAEILKAPDDRWREMLAEWAQSDATRERKAFQAQAEERARAQVQTGHGDLIKTSIEVYAPRFLPGFEVLYIDDADGDRVSEDEQEKLKRAGISITLSDAMPDVLLWNPKTDWAWIIEAVTSDGEVDHHKVQQVNTLIKRCGKAGVGFTTTYPTWKHCSARQSKHKNLAIGTYIWIAEDPAKQFYISSYV